MKFNIWWMLFVIFLKKSNVHHQKRNPFWAESQVVLILFKEECHSGGQERKQQFYLSSRWTCGFGVEDCCLPDAWIITWIMPEVWWGSYLWIFPVLLMLSSHLCSGVRWREQDEMATWTITFLSKQTALAALEPLPLHKVLPTSPLIHLIFDIPGACVLSRRHCHYWLCVRGETMSRECGPFQLGSPPPGVRSSKHYRNTFWCGEPKLEGVRSSWMMMHLWVNTLVADQCPHPGLGVDSPADDQGHAEML